MSKKQKLTATDSKSCITHFFGVRVPEERDVGPCLERWLPPTQRGARVRHTIGGTLQIKCLNNTCTRVEGPTKFIPEKNAADRADYLTAIGTLTAAISHKDVALWQTARDTIARLAVGNCDSCRTASKKCNDNSESKVGKCKKEAARLHDVFARCADCGTDRAVEADHGKSYSDNGKAYREMLKNGSTIEEAELKYPKAERKVFSVFAYEFWKDNGGVVGMRAEAAKCTPRCKMCHAIDECSDSAECNRSRPESVKCGDYETHRAFQKEVLHRTYRKEKHAYNATLKQALGRCENSDCTHDGPSGGKIDGYEQCFDWDHQDRAQKSNGISELCCDSKCPETAKPLIDAERLKCRLLCKNCHHLKSHKQLKIMWV